MDPMMEKLKQELVDLTAEKSRPPVLGSSTETSRPNRTCAFRHGRLHTDIGQQEEVGKMSALRPAFEIKHSAFAPSCNQFDEGAIRPVLP